MLFTRFAALRKVFSFHETCFPGVFLATLQAAQSVRLFRNRRIVRASCCPFPLHLPLLLLFRFLSLPIVPFLLLLLLLLLLGLSRSGSVRFREMLYVKRWETATEKRFKASKGNLSIAWQQVGGNQRGWIPRSIQRLPVCEAASLRCFYSTLAMEQKRAPEERETIHACLRAHQYTGESFMHEERRNSWMFFSRETSNREFVIDCSCLARAREISLILWGGRILLGLLARWQRK